MKIQDIIFILVFLVLIYLRKPKASAWAGILSLLLSMPLFFFWIFFTADRLTWYAAAFFLLSIIQYLKLIK